MNRRFPRCPKTGQARVPSQTGLLSRESRMSLSRRTFVEHLGGLAAALLSAPALAQTPPAVAPASPAAPAPARFGFDDVIKRARDLAALPYDAAAAPLP